MSAPWYRGEYLFFHMKYICFCFFSAMNDERRTCHSNCATDRAEYEREMCAGDIWAQWLDTFISWKFIWSDSLSDRGRTKTVCHFLWIYYYYYLFVCYNLTLRCHLGPFVMQIFCAANSYDLRFRWRLSWRFSQCDRYFRATHCCKGATCQLFCLFSSTPSILKSTCH